MTTSRRSTDYPLGNTDAEHERLIRQAARVAPITEDFFARRALDSGNAFWISVGGRGRGDAGCPTGGSFGRGCGH